MSDKGTLGRSRTVRLSAAIDGRLQAKAAKTGKSVSELIRQTIEAEYNDDLETAGTWILKISNQPARERVIHSDRKAFREAYQRRHR